MSDYTIENLRNVEDSAAGFGVGDTQEARFAREVLNAESTGVSFHLMRPGKRQAFGHRHTNAEEVYVVTSGSGRVKLEDDIRPIEAFDAVRVAPGVSRAFEGGPDGMEFLAFGPRHDGDGEVLPDFWPAD